MGKNERFFVYNNEHLFFDVHVKLIGHWQLDFINNIGWNESLKKAFQRMHEKHYIA